MLDLWKRHVAWRFAPTGRAVLMVKRIEHAERRRTANTLGVCTRCHGPRDSAHYKRCAACRKDTTGLQRRRMARMRAEADGTACIKCHNPNPDAGKFKLCPLCRERARDVAARQRMKHAT